MIRNRSLFCNFTFRPCKWGFRINVRLRHACSWMKCHLPDNVNEIMLFTYALGQNKMFISLDWNGCECVIAHTIAVKRRRLEGLIRAVDWSGLSLELFLLCPWLHRSILYISLSIPLSLSLYFIPHTSASLLIMKLLFAIATSCVTLPSFLQINIFFNKKTL